MKYLIGIDAGGTKTRAKAYDLQGNCLFEAMGGAGNIVLHFENTTKVLQELIAKIRSNVSGNCQMLLLGISGIDTSGKAEELLAIFDKFAKKVVIINDAELGILNKLKGRDGMLVIAGTGSVAYVKKKDQGIRQGGWGHLIGDEGSGYWLGLQCYKKLASDYDQTLEHLLTPFSEAFLAFLKVKDPLVAIKRIYDLDKKGIAESAKFLAEKASDHAEAREILTQAGNELAQLAQKLFVKSGSAYNISLAVTGSVLEKNPLVYATFSQKMKKYTTNIILNSEENTKAVWYLYNKEG